MERIIFTLLLLLAATAEGQAKETRFVSVTPTVTAGAYAAKDVVGGLLTFTAPVCTSSGTGRVVAVMVSDKAANAVEYNLILFKSNPTSSTFTNDATFDPADGDLAKILPVINIASTDCFSFTDNGICSLSSLASAGASTASGGALYAVLEAVGTPTYASNSDITVTLAFQCD